MELAAGWNLDAATLGRLKLMESLFDSTSGRRNLPVGAFEGKGLRSMLSAEFVGYWLDIKFLAGEGLLERVWIGNLSYWALTNQGILLVEDIRRRRADPAERRVACRDALLNWSYRNPHGQHVDIREFGASPYARFFGEHFPWAEVSAALEWLERAGLVSVRLIGGHDSSLHVATTTDGAEMVERGRSTRQLNESAGSVSYHVSNSTGVAISHHGTNSPQTVTVGSTPVTDELRTRLTQLAEAIEQAVPALGLTEANRAEALGIAAEMRYESRQQTADAGRLRKLANRLGEVAVSGSGSALGAGIVALAQQLGALMS